MMALKEALDALKRYDWAGCLEALKDSDDPAVRALADGELAPLLQNKELLNAYMGLMIGG